jgi:enterochelin esterase family protein
MLPHHRNNKHNSAVRCIIAHCQCTALQPVDSEDCTMSFSGKISISRQLLSLGALAMFSIASPALAQPAPAAPAPASVQSSVISPEIHPDRTVTFRLYAPKASDVTLTGDWLATLESRTGGTTKMTKGADGVWSYTSTPLEATGHLYFFTLDGLPIADPVNPVTKSRSQTSASLVEVPRSPTPVWQLQQVPRGQVAINTQHSAAYDDEHPFAVYLPPGYQSGSRRYPVLYLVHGSGDVFISWTTAGNANIILDNLIAQKKAVPMIVVMPFLGRAYPSLPADPGREQFEAYLTKELVPYIDANYRTLADRKDRAMAGLSAGGGATFNVGLKHPELFSQFGFFSAGEIAPANVGRYPWLASEKAAADKFDLFWISFGNQDPNHVPAAAFDAALTKNGVKHTYVTRDGGHVWPVWRWSLAEFAPLLFRNK